MIGLALLGWWLVGLALTTVMVVRYRRTYNPRNPAADCIGGLLIALALGPFVVILWPYAASGHMDRK